MTWKTRITTEPGVLAGKPIVKGTRLAVDFILRPAAIDRRPAFSVRHSPSIASPEYRGTGDKVELVPIYKRVIGLDVHQAQITACAILEAPDGSVKVEQRQFGACKPSAPAARLAWGLTPAPDSVVMESTGVYWKSPYVAREAVGLRAAVASTRHVKQVPGRKTDVGDAQWPAMLARAGLLQASFVPPATLREFRLKVGRTAGLRGKPPAQGADRCRRRPWPAPALRHRPARPQPALCHQRHPPGNRAGILPPAKSSRPAWIEQWSGIPPTKAGGTASGAGCRSNSMQRRPRQVRRQWLPMT